MFLKVFCASLKHIYVLDDLLLMMQIYRFKSILFKLLQDLLLVLRMQVALWKAVVAVVSVIVIESSSRW